MNFFSRSLTSEPCKDLASWVNGCPKSDSAPFSGNCKKNKKDGISLRNLIKNTMAIYLFYSAISIVLISINSIVSSSCGLMIFSCSFWSTICFCYLTKTRIRFIDVSSFSLKTSVPLFIHLHIFLLAFIYSFSMRSKITHMWSFPTVKMDPELNIMEVFENTDLR